MHIRELNRHITHMCYVIFFDEVTLYICVMCLGCVHSIYAEHKKIQKDTKNIHMCHVGFSSTLMFITHTCYVFF